MWSDGLVDWYRVHGRHHLPWRKTTEPWAVLVSEVMLQQTSVARVVPRWERFLARWPSPDECAAASLEEVLREWHGLGYPRRARSLWLVADAVRSGGWPADERGLTTLPGIGTYTARALLAFSDLGGAGARCAPRDVNVNRVAARAGCGCEPNGAPSGQIDQVLADGHPRQMSLRDYSYALFDVGATHCRSIPRCAGCPLEHTCPVRHRVGFEAPRSPQVAYRGSFRELRGAVLGTAIATPGLTRAALRERLSSLSSRQMERFDEACASLVADGLLPDLAP